MNDEELLVCFGRGLIPGPQETEEAFVQRVQQAAALSNPEWQAVAQATLSLFGFAIDWVPLSYSSQELSPWEGAATWIGEGSLPSIQLRPAFAKGSFLGYRRSDVLAHEAVHAARMRFEEPRFEEMLAYRTSPQRWKRFLGPAFQHKWTLYLLLLTLLAGVYQPWISLLLISLGLSVLCCRHFQLRRCLRQFPLPMVLCMTDAEIISCTWKKEDGLRSRLLKSIRNNHELSS